MGRGSVNNAPVLIEAREERKRLERSATSTDLKLSTDVASIRRQFPAHWRLEQIHLLTSPAGIRHLRIPERYTNYRRRGGPDDPICGLKKAPGAGWNYGSGGQHGRVAIDQATCEHCLQIAAQLLADAEGEATALERELRGMRASLGVLEGQSKARRGSAE